MRTVAAYSLMCLLAVLLATMASHHLVDWTHRIAEQILLTLNRT